MTLMLNFARDQAYNQPNRGTHVVPPLMRNGNNPPVLRITL